MRNRFLHKMSLFLLCSLLLIGCKFDDLYYATDVNCSVRLNIDWQKHSDIQLNGASVYVYNSDGSLFKVFPPYSNPHKLDLALPVGCYDIIIHNNTPYELPNLSFDNINDRDKFLIKHIETKSSEIKNVNEVDHLILGQINNLEITQELRDYFPYKPNSYESVEAHLECDVATKIITSELEVIANVKGLSNAATAPECVIDMMNGELCLMRLEQTQKPVNLQFVLNNRKLNSSNTDGIISKTIKNLGFIDDTGKGTTIKLSFLLTNGEKHVVTIPLEGKIKKESELKYKVKIECELPNVGGGGGDSGFDTDVSDWEDYFGDINM